LKGKKIANVCIKIKSTLFSNIQKIPTITKNDPFRAIKKKCNRFIKNKIYFECILLNSKLIEFLETLSVLI
jgi:hypothetical protein